jgi:hypothetical protein
MANEMPRAAEDLLAAVDLEAAWPNSGTSYSTGRSSKEPSPLVGERLLRRGVVADVFIVAEQRSRPGPATSTTCARWPR